MNILLVNHYIGSPYYGMDFRPYYISREWVKMGHKVTMVGATQSHLRMIQPEVDKDLTTEYIDGIQYVWIKTPSYDKSSSYKRIINMMAFVSKLLLYAKQLAKISEPDWVIASSCYPLDIYPSRKIAKIANAKLCFEVHDIWPLTPILVGGYSKYHPFIVTMQTAENYMCRHSDKIVSLLWNAESHYREHGFKGHFYWVRNGYCKEDWTPEVFSRPLPEQHSELFCKLKKDGKTIIGFSGGFAAAGAVHTLVEAACILKDRGNISFVLVGKGPEKESIEKIAKGSGLNNVYFLPPVAKQLIPALVSQFDIAFLGGIHSELHKYGTSPNKITDYMLAKKPIVMSIDEPGSIVDRIQCGIRVEAENEKELANAIETILDMTEEERNEMGLRGEKYVKENLEWGILADKFITYLKE